MLILVTGATGKVGRTFIGAVRGDPRWKQAKIRALCHNRTLPEDERLSVLKGSIADRAVAEAAMRDVTHVVHLATCKETPEDVVGVVDATRTFFARHMEGASDKLSQGPGSTYRERFERRMAVTLARFDAYERHRLPIDEIPPDLAIPEGPRP